MKQEGFVYVLSLGYDNLYKIGKTIDSHRRLKDFQASNPKAKYCLCKWVHNRSKVEYDLHYIYKYQKKDRELYGLDQQAITDIEKYLVSKSPSNMKEKRDKRLMDNHKRRIKAKKPKSVPGIRRTKRSWAAEIEINGKLVCLGYFHKRRQAIQARKIAKLATGQLVSVVQD